MQQITPADWASWVEQQNTRPVLLDVREAWELQTASIQTDAADLLHMPMNTVPARLMELDRQRPVACLCHHGARSMQVAHFLAAQGFETVNIAGGIHAWSVQVDPRIPLY